MATYAPAATTPAPGAFGTLSVEGIVDAIVDEVKGFFKLHYGNITGAADLSTKIKVLLYDGRVWMLGVSILLLVLAYQNMRAKNAVATARAVHAVQQA